MAPTTKIRRLGSAKKAARRGKTDRHVRPARIRNPASGLTIAPGLSIYHDAAGGEFACVPKDGVKAHFVIYQFHGSYLSVAAALGSAQRRRLGPGRSLAARLDVQTSRPLTVFLRLNFRSETATEELYETIVVHTGVKDLRFDLDAARIALHEVGSVWMDIIFSEPEMSEISIAQLALEVVDDSR